MSVGLDKFANRLLYPILWTLPGSMLESSFTTKDLGITGGLTSLIGADSYSLFKYPIENIHPILCIHDNAPFMPISCFTFSHSAKLELTMGANPQSISIKTQQDLDTICHKLCHQVLHEFLNLTLSRSTK